MSYHRKIKCPRHHMVKPGQIAWQIEENPFTIDTKMDDATCKRFGIKKWKYKRDRYGNKIPNFKNHYQPEISASYALEFIYDNGNPICSTCKRCLEGFSNAHLLPKKSTRNDGGTFKQVVAEMAKQLIKNVK